MEDPEGLKYPGHREDLGGPERMEDPEGLGGPECLHCPGNSKEQEDPEGPEGLRDLGDLECLGGP